MQKTEKQIIYSNHKKSNYEIIQDFFMHKPKKCFYLLFS